jgi:hypothetical protein
VARRTSANTISIMGLSRGDRIEFPKRLRQTRPCGHSRSSGKLSRSTARTIGGALQPRREFRCRVIWVLSRILGQNHQCFCPASLSVLPSGFNSCAHSRAVIRSESESLSAFSPSLRCLSSSGLALLLPSHSWGRNTGGASR